MTSLITLMKQLGAALLPCGMTSHSKSLSGAQKAARGIMPLSIVFWWKEETRSNREKMRPRSKESRILSTWGVGGCPRELMALSFLQFIVMRTPPHLLGIATMELE